MDNIFISRTALGNRRSTHQLATQARLNRLICHQPRHKCREMPNFQPTEQPTGWLGIFNKYLQLLISIRQFWHKICSEQRSEKTLSELDLSSSHSSLRRPANNVGRAFFLEDTPYRYAPPSKRLGIRNQLPVPTASSPWNRITRIRLRPRQIPKFANGQLNHTSNRVFPPKVDDQRQKHRVHLNYIYITAQFSFSDKTS